jgi:hypothetical protein
MWFNVPAFRGASHTFRTKLYDISHATYKFCNNLDCELAPEFFFLKKMQSYFEAVQGDSIGMSQSIQELGWWCKSPYSTGLQPLGYN